MKNMSLFVLITALVFVAGCAEPKEDITEKYQADVPVRVEFRGIDLVLSDEIHTFEAESWCEWDIQWDSYDCEWSDSPYDYQQVAERLQKQAELRLHDALGFKLALSEPKCETTYREKHWDHWRVKGFYWYDRVVCRFGLKGGETRGWKASVSRSAVSDEMWYITVSGKGKIEFPLTAEELRQILTDELWDEVILWEDPAVEAGAENYLEASLRHAAHIEEDGELVASFSWQNSVEGSDTVSAIAGRVLQMKATKQGSGTYNAAWVGYLGTRQAATTSITADTRLNTNLLCVKFDQVYEVTSKLENFQEVKGSLYLKKVDS